MKKQAEERTGRRLAAVEQKVNRAETVANGYPVTTAKRESRFES